MLGNANQFMGFVQCQSWNRETWQPYSNVQEDEKNSILPIMWNMNFGFAMVTSSIMWGATIK